MSAARRQFLLIAIGTGAALGWYAISRSARALGGPQATTPLRILILGGTGFIGPHQVEHALSRGHTVTVFNGGKTNPHLFPDVEKLIGNRDNDLEALKGKDWDVVLDNSATIPRWVGQSALLLRDAAQRYLFVSTISMYSDYSIVGLNESCPTRVMEDSDDETLSGRNYGPMKALCEKEAELALPGRATIVLPGLIVGPGDRTDRFTYWPVRIDRGGEALAPGNPTDPTQIVDVRDLTGWMIRMLEEGHTGT